jgi:hypothetical protein
VIALLIVASAAGSAALGWYGHKALLCIQAWGEKMNEQDAIFQSVMSPEERAAGLAHAKTPPISKPPLSTPSISDQMTYGQVRIGAARALVLITQHEEHRLQAFVDSEQSSTHESFTQPRSLDRIAQRQLVLRELSAEDGR